MFQKNISGIGASSSVVQILIVGHDGGNYEDIGGNPYKLPKEFHGEDGAEKHRQDVSNTGSRRGVQGIWNADSGHIHHPQEGEGGTVGGFKTNI